jgi:hypothetical protein
VCVPRDGQPGLYLKLIGDLLPRDSGVDHTLNASSAFIEMLKIISPKPPKLIEACPYV